MIYNSHFYGSNLWNLFAIDDVYIAWNNVVRMVFDLPRSTHRCLLEPVHLVIKNIKIGTN